jgi:hypothetical protein
MIRFTDTYIKNLKPKEKRDEKYEGGGFGIFIYPSGSKTWIYQLHRTSSQTALANKTTY